MASFQEVVTASLLGSEIKTTNFLSSVTTFILSTRSEEEMNRRFHLKETILVLLSLFSTCFRDDHPENVVANVKFEANISNSHDPAFNSILKTRNTNFGYHNLGVKPRKTSDIPIVKIPFFFLGLKNFRNISMSFSSSSLLLNLPPLQGANRTIQTGPLDISTTFLLLK